MRYRHTMNRLAEDRSLSVSTDVETSFVWFNPTRRRRGRKAARKSNTFRRRCKGIKSESRHRQGYSSPPCCHVTHFTLSHPLSCRLSRVLNERQGKCGELWDTTELVAFLCEIINALSPAGSNKQGRRTSRLYVNWKGPPEFKRVSRR